MTDTSTHADFNMFKNDNFQNNTLNSQQIEIKGCEFYGKSEKS